MPGPTGARVHPKERVVEAMARNVALLGSKPDTIRPGFLEALLLREKSVDKQKSNSLSPKK